MTAQEEDRASPVRANKAYTVGMAEERDVALPITATDASKFDEQAILERSVPVLPDDDPRLIQWVNPLTQQLLAHLHKTKDWSNVDHRQLEEVVAELFDGFGFEVELTARTRDGGRDVIAIQHHFIKDNKYLIECKHQRDNVDVSVVRELLGVGQLEDHSGLIIATTSGFTKDAVNASRKERARFLLALKDRDGIHEWIHKYAKLKGWI